MPKKQSYDITEVTEIFSIRETLILQCIEHKWIEPVDPKAKKLDQEDISRLNFIQDLQEGMGVNDEAVPIILHLVDQIHYLRLKIEEEETKQD